MSALVGADADELEELARMLRSAADELDGHAGSVTATLRSVAWVGGVATRFGSNWSGGHRPRINSTARYVRDAAAALDRNAAEQRRASRGSTADPGDRWPASSGSSPLAGGTVSGAGPVPARSGSLGQIDELLGGLGLARDQIEMVADLVDRLSEHGEIGRVIDLLTDDAFVTFLRGADHVLDAGSVIVDVVGDVADHPGLPFDERIVHALADTAVRFGLSQGMEVAAEWLAGAATAALLPGFGAILAPFVGGMSGAIAGELLDVVVDVVDDAIDGVDLIADGVVATYQGVKDAVGIVADVAEAAFEVAGGAVDLAGDAAGAVLDVGGAAIDAGADLAGLAGDVVGSVNPFDGS